MNTYKSDDVKTVLVVDDEEDLRDVLKTLFSLMGFAVLEAKNAVEAYEIIQTKPVNLVISDVRMPGGNGVELLQMVRKRDPKIPVVILVSGYTDVSHEEAIRLGASAFLSKPFDLNVIKELALSYVPLTHSN